MADDASNAKKVRGQRRGGEGSPSRRKRLLIVAGILGIGVIGAGIAAVSMRASPQQRFDHYVELANGLLANQDFAQAEKFARDALAIRADEPESAPAHTVLARVLLAQKQTDEGMEELKRAVELDPKLREARMLLLLKHMGAGENEEARAQLDELFRHQPVPAEVYEFSAVLHLQTGYPQKALEDWEGAVRAAPGTPHLYLTAAYMSDLLGRLTWDDALQVRAQELFQKAEASIDDEFKNGSIVAGIHLAQGRFEAAREALDAAPDDNPLRVALIRAEIAEAKGDLEAAEEILRDAADNISSAYISAALVRLLARWGNLNAAHRELDRAAQKFPEDPVLWLARVSLMAASVQDVDADDLLVRGLMRPSHGYNILEKDLAAGFRANTNDAAALRARIGFAGPAALALMRSGVPDAEVGGALQRDLDALLELERNDGYALAWKGALLFAGGRSEEALTTLDRALRHEKNMREIYHLRGLVLGSLGRWEEAAQDAEKSVEGGNQTPARVAACARARHRAGRVEDAVAMASRAHAQPDWSGDVTLMGVLYAALKDLPESGDMEARRQQIAYLEARLRVARGGESEVTSGSSAGKKFATNLVKGSFGQAAALMRRKIEENPGNTPELAKQKLGDRLQLAHYLERAGKRREAQDIFRQLAQESDEVELDLQYATYLMRNGEFVEAEAELDTLVEANPENVGVRLALASVAIGLGKRPKALKQFKALMWSTAPVRFRGRAAAQTLASIDPAPELVADVEKWLEQNPGDTAAQLLATGYVHLARNELEQAIDCGVTASQLEPTDVDSRVLIARAHLKADRLELAETALEDALAISPDNRMIRPILSEVRLHLAIRAISADDVVEGRRRLELAVGDVSTDLLVGVLLAQAFSREPDPAAATAAYTRLNRAYPSSAAAPLFMGHLSGTQGEYDAALEHFQEAMTRAPDRPLPVVGYVSACILKKDLPRAAAMARRKIGQGDKSGIYHYLLARTMTLEGKDDEAIASYQEALRRDPTNAAAVMRIIPLLTRAKQADEIKAVLDGLAASQPRSRTRTEQLTRQLLTLDAVSSTDAWVLIAVASRPDSAGAHIGLGQVLMRAGDAESAVAQFGKAIELAPEAPGAYLQFATGLVLLKRTDEARERLTAATKKYPGNPSPWTALGMLDEAAGDQDKAIANYRKAMDASPDAAIAANNLAWIIGVKRKSPKEGLEIIAPAKQKFPNDGNIADSFGWLLHLLGRHEEALEELDIALRTHAGSGQTVWHRAEILRALDRKEDALAAYARVRELDPKFAEQNGVAAAIQQLGGK